MRVIDGAPPVEECELNDLEKAAKSVARKTLKSKGFPKKPAEIPPRAGLIAPVRRVLPRKSKRAGAFVVSGMMISRFIDFNLSWHIHIVR